MKNLQTCDHYTYNLNIEVQLHILTYEVDNEYLQSKNARYSSYRLHQ